MIWSEHIRVDTHDTDYIGNVRPSAILRFMQECANLQQYNTHPSNEELREIGMGFILSRISISYYLPIHAYDELTVQTWSCESKGYSFHRCYRILRGEETVAEATAVWALLDINERKLLKVTDYHPQYTPEPPLSVEFPLRLRLPELSEMKLRGEYTVTYSDTDCNRHMNNTRYPDMLFHFLGQPENRVLRMSITFQNEAPFCETLKVYTDCCEGIHYIRTVRSDGKVNVEAEVVLEDSDF